MNGLKNDVNIKIMGRAFSIKCPPDKVTDLHKAAKYLDTKINEIKTNYTKIGNKDTLIIIAALNIVNELFQQKHATHDEILNIQQMIEGKLAEEG